MEYEYRIMRRNATKASGTAGGIKITDGAVARAGCVWLDYCYPALGPHVVQRRVLRHDDEWQDVPDDS